jgi:hypothetical protein
LTPAEHPLASAYQANQEAFLIHIIYISGLKVVFGDLLMQQLESRVYILIQNQPGGAYDPWRWSTLR